MTRVALLGSTGSIGTQTLQVARHLHKRIEVVAVAGGSNTELLSQQIAEFQPRMFCSLYPERVIAGGAVQATMEEIASDEGIDTVVVATTGRAGLAPTLAALAHGKCVALANKEVLVMAGDMVKAAAKRCGAGLVPIDSEHSAIWQCLQGESSPRRLFLTASGGPFYDCAEEQIRMVTPEQALAHPVWSMGSKITIDSATLMNKGLEIIEAHWLFEMPYEDIEVLIHRQCIVHSMVEFGDGTIKAHLSQPDMALAIQYALTHPSRHEGQTPPLSWDTPRTFSFEPVNTTRFPCLDVARKAGLAGRTYPSALCGADEAAVDLFLSGVIGFADIAPSVDSALSAHDPTDATSVDAILAAEEWAQEYVRSNYRNVCSRSETRK